VFLSKHERSLGNDAPVVSANTSLVEAHPARSESEQQETNTRIPAFMPNLPTFMPNLPKCRWLILYNHELTVNCDACQHRAPVSVPGLAARLGENYRVHAFIERAVCSKCGARWPKLSVTVVPVKMAGYRSRD